MEMKAAQETNDLETVVHTYGSMLYRLCVVMLGNESDAEDAVQETIIKYFLKAPEFENEEHKKAWLIKVAANQCRDMLRSRKRRTQMPLDWLPAAADARSDSGILDALMTLPEKFRIVLTLYYVEEWPMEQIARSIGRTSSAVKMRLRKGRKLLEDVYRKEYL